MALFSALTTLTPRKRRIFAATKPDYSDFSGPPDGDYVRYVEGLVAWAAQEQERQRLQAMGGKARAPWGHEAVQTRAVLPSMAQPGSVAQPLEQVARTSQKLRQQMLQTARTPQSLSAHGASGTHRTTPRHHVKSSLKPKPWVVLGLGGLVAALVFAGAAHWLPWVIIVWVAYNVIRAVRAASSARKP